MALRPLRLRPECANSGHSATARRTGQIDRACVKTPRSFYTPLVLVCFRGLRSIGSRKIAKNFVCEIVGIFFDDFLHSLDPKHAFEMSPMNGR